MLFAIFAFYTHTEFFDDIFFHLNFAEVIPVVIPNLRKVSRFGIAIDTTLEFLFLLGLLYPDIKQYCCFSFTVGLQFIFLVIL